MNKQQRVKIRLGIFALIIILAIPISCQGFFLDELFEEWFFEETSDNQIINKVKVETNTGGNVIEQGTGKIIEGKGESKIEVRTIINGQEIEPIEIESDAEEIKVKQEIVVGEDKEPIIQQEIEIEPDKEEPCEDCKSPIQNWWSGFINSLKSIFKGIINIFK